MNGYSDVYKLLTFSDFERFVNKYARSIFGVFHPVEAELVIAAKATSSGRLCCIESSFFICFARISPLKYGNISRALK